ncbi:helix-turn-helix domain-containing protein [Dryocola sp. BD626]|uniref:helix-turn-helix domain-containing protein n=1 Tax=Dryocola sp. BD626 TaxID=3133273 RepID=UPI003F500D54
MSMPARFMESLIEWIEDNMDKPLRIEDVARHSGYSKWYLQRMFTSTTGKSMGTYIRERKLLLAADDLVNTNDRIVDISERYGFDSQQSFTRIFGKKYNVSPSAYRKSSVQQVA